jgi:cytochrome P450
MRVYDPPDALQDLYTAGPVLTTGPVPIVRSHSDVSYVHARPRLFSSQLVPAGMSQQEFHPLATAYWALHDYDETGRHDPVHSRLKGITAPYFTGEPLEQALKKVPGIFAALIDQATEGAQPNGSFDLSELAYQGALRSVCVLTGFPVDQVAWAHEVIEEFTNRQPPFVDLSPPKQDVSGRLDEIIRNRRRLGAGTPDDMLSQLIRAHDGELEGIEPITLRQIHDYMLMFLGAGGHTLGAAAAKFPAVLADRGLLDNISRYVNAEASLADIEQMLSGHREEADRLVTTFPFGARTALADGEFPSGFAFRKGQRLLLDYASANRDPSVFPNPDDYAPLRPNLNRGKTFGGGIHLCAGAAFARRAQILALVALLRRVPDVRIEVTGRTLDLIDRLQVTASYGS